MKTTGFVSRRIIISILVLASLAMALGQAGPAEQKAEVSPLLQKVLRITTKPEPNAPQNAAVDAPPGLRPRASFVRTADFYLKDGRLVYGKLVSEDKNKITVEELNGSEIIVNTYSRRDVDIRTIQTKSAPESRYYQDLAEYFAGRTWDFKDDPDDFIHAIRCYERAKALIVGKSRLDTERIQEIDERIKLLQADRQVWEREVASRAKLKEMEFKAEFETKLSDLKDQLVASSQKIDENIKRLDTVITEIQENSQQVLQNFPAVEQDLRNRLSVLANQVEANRRMMDPSYTGPRFRTRYGPYRYGY